jgi:hypothetical protein
MMKAVHVALLTIAVAGFASAGWGPSVPEIGAGSAASTLALLAGALIVIRARRK